MTRVSLHDLAFSYGSGEPPAVAGADLEVAAGELMVLLGPSGSGKTTTLRLVAGLLTPGGGDVRFDGRSMQGVPPERRGAVMVFQGDSLFPFRTVAENLEFGLKMRAVARRERPGRIAEALAAVQLAGFEDRWPDELSGGQQQRVALARALVVRPALLLLDEPLRSLEPELRADLRATISSVQRAAAITTILVTHDQAEAVAVADRIAVMIGGRIRQVGPPAAFYHRPADAEVARFFGAANLIPGERHGDKVRTEVGMLEVDGAGGGNGPVMLVVRPEAVELAAAERNSFSGRVEHARFGGSAVDCTVVVGSTRLRLLVPPARSPAPGDLVSVHLPVDAIHVLPGDVPH